ncbi:MAG: CDP-glucose 4,6-dehydratase [Rhodocyclaceae bacterium]
MDLTFWKGRRVLITGHTGFKGAWLCIWLKQLGAEVFGYSLPPPTTPSLFEAASVTTIIADSVFADVADLKRLEDMISRASPEIVFHMAAQSLVRTSYRAPVETYATNVMGTVHLLEAIRRKGNTVLASIVVTSDKCYENREWLWGYREDEPLGGGDPYSSSKACAEIVTAAYRKSFPEHCATVATVRAGNVIGGGDWATDRLIADAALAFSANKPVHLRFPDATRPWQHVLDALHGYLLLAMCLVDKGREYSGGWNFGPADTDTRSVGWVVSKMAELWGEGARWETDAGSFLPEARTLRLDSSKARSNLGWHPSLGLEEALRWVVDWYKGFYSFPSEALTLCRGQVEEYHEKINRV